MPLRLFSEGSQNDWFLIMNKIISLSKYKEFGLQEKVFFIQFLDAVCSLTAQYLSYTRAA